jgi:CubicO group peptidase (beta-lactamase class C family)
VEEGKISLDSNVNNYLKSWKLPDNEFTKNKKVALKHLLSHTGGLTVHGFLGYSPDLPVPSLLQVLDGEQPANSPAIRVDKVPDESFRYSGGGYTIMQQMLIDIEGKDFPSITKEKVLQPLGMIHSTYQQPLPPDLLKLAATGYLPDGSMTKGKRHTYPEMAAAGLWTTAEDLALFAIDIQKSLKGEGGVLSKTMVEKMLTPVLPKLYWSWNISQRF